MSLPMDKGQMPGKIQLTRHDGVKKTRISRQTETGHK